MSSLGFKICIGIGLSVLIFIVFLTSIAVIREIYIEDHEFMRHDRHDYDKKWPPKHPHHNQYGQNYHKPASSSKPYLKPMTTEPWSWNKYPTTTLTSFDPQILVGLYFFKSSHISQENFANA